MIRYFFVFGFRKQLFFAGSITGLIEDEAKSFVEDYVDEAIDSMIDRTLILPFTWVNDVIILGKVQDQKNYRTSVIINGKACSMSDIIASCTIDY